MKKRNRFFKLDFIILIIACVMSMLACDEKQVSTTMEPAHSQTSAMLEAGAKMQGLKLVSRKSRPAAASVGTSSGMAGNKCRGTSYSRRIIADQGGTVEYCGHSIWLPSGTLTQDGVVTIKVADSDHITVAIESDVRFEGEFLISMSYSDADIEGINPYRLNLASYSETTGEWSNLASSVNLGGKNISSIIKQHTLYTICFD